jgi:hypothetical protein
MRGPLYALCYGSWKAVDVHRNSNGHLRCNLDIHCAMHRQKKSKDKDYAAVGSLALHQAGSRQLDPWRQLFPMREDILLGCGSPNYERQYIHKLIESERMAPSLLYWLSVRNVGAMGYTERRRYSTIHTRAIFPFTSQQFGEWCLRMQQIDMGAFFKLLQDYFGIVPELMTTAMRVGCVVELYREWCLGKLMPLSLKDTCEFVFNRPAPEHAMPVNISHLFCLMA